LRPTGRACARAGPTPAAAAPGWAPGRSGSSGSSAARSGAGAHLALGALGRPGRALLHLGRALQHPAVVDLLRQLRGGGGACKQGPGPGEGQARAAGQRGEGMALALASTATSPGSSSSQATQTAAAGPARPAGKQAGRSPPPRSTPAHPSRPPTRHCRVVVLAAVVVPHTLRGVADHKVHHGSGLGHVHGAAHLRRRHAQLAPAPQGPQARRVPRPGELSKACCAGGGSSSSSSGSSGWALAGCGRAPRCRRAA
jgi:hypothetical protein